MTRSVLDTSSPQRQQSPAGLPWLLVLLFASLVTLGHGCHAGDHDDELRFTEPSTFRSAGGTDPLTR